jgi:hypothetical protein
MGIFSSFYRQVEPKKEIKPSEIINKLEHFNAAHLKIIIACLMIKYNERDWDAIIENFKKDLLYGKTN